MWTNLILTLVMFIVLTYVIQWLVPSARGRQGAGRRTVSRDIAPIVGFFGLLLLVLSFVEAARALATLAWGLGAALGLVLAVGLWLGLMYWWRLPVPAPVQRRGSSLRMALRIVRTYGLIFVIGLLGLNVAIRVLGSAAEVFVSGAMGVLVVGAAAAVFTKVASRP